MALYVLYAKNLLILNTVFIGMGMSPMGQRPPMHGMGPRPRPPMGGLGMRGRGGMMHGRPRANMMPPGMQNQVFKKISCANSCYITAIPVFH